MGDYISAKWKERWGEDLLTPKEITDIIYLGAKNTFGDIEFSTSHRRFVEYEHTQNEEDDSLEMQKAPTFMNHLEYVRTGKEENFELGFQRHNSRAFYKNMRARFITAGLKNRLPPVDVSYSS